jgi:hypothetical protein
MSHIIPRERMNMSPASCGPPEALATMFSRYGILVSYVNHAGLRARSLGLSRRLIFHNRLRRKSQGPGIPIDYQGKFGSF